MTRKEWYEKWLPHLREALHELALEVNDPSMMAGRWVVEDEDEEDHTVGAWVFLIGPHTEDLLAKVTQGHRTHHIESIDEIDDDTLNIVAGPEGEQ